MGNSCSNHLGIPPAKGPNAVGCTDFMMDHTAQGSFFRLYYPCQTTEKAERPDWVPCKEYFNGLTDFMNINRTLGEKIFNYLFGSFKIPASLDAPFKSNVKCPVVIFSHGLGAFRTLYSAICAELASHGFIVASVGDRHLSNFMINMETGGMVGIDFGHAFGSATQFLPVPELMPFRLTQQFVNLMQPLKESGLIQSIMVHSLRAYRAEPDLLLNTMDVFVKEPSLDWKNFELKQLKKGGTWTDNVNTKEINWYPLQKVNFARRKLEGANPAAITSEELALGFEKDAAFPGMQSVALGSEEHNIRARLPAAGLPVEKQVDCLLDQAMDPNVLGRVWVGWEPWM